MLTKERRVLMLQLEALRIEVQQAEQDMSNQNRMHQTEMNSLRQESLQVGPLLQSVFCFVRVSPLGYAVVA